MWLTSTRYNMYNIQCPTDTGTLILKKDVPARAVSLNEFLIVIQIRREM